MFLRRSVASTPWRCTHSLSACCPSRNTEVPDSTLPPLRSRTGGPHPLCPPALFWGPMISCPLQTTLQFQTSPRRARLREAIPASVRTLPEAGRQGLRRLKTRPRKGPKITDTLSARNQTGSQIIRGVELLSSLAALGRRPAKGLAARAGAAAGGMGRGRRGAY